MPGMQIVKVTVAGNQISVDRDPLDLNGAGPNVEIQWHITTQGWTFADNGIVIPDNDGQFHDGRVAQQGTRYIWIDNNSGGKTYKYTVNVTHGAIPLSLDPSIINQP